ncbi:hypothetical protein BJX99DRAFT_230790 [Aspergillus californicus]
MSHPIINIAVRRLSRPQATRATISAVSFPGPTASLSASASSRRTFALSSAPKRTLRIHDSLLQCSRAYLNPRQPRSNFSSSAANPAPQVTQNPKVDDDGNTLMIGISERAANVRLAISFPATRSFHWHVMLELPCLVDLAPTYFRTSVAKVRL